VLVGELQDAVERGRRLAMWDSERSKDADRL
jgi:hypothetical protein